MTARTTDPLVSPVTVDDLADWLGVDNTDTLLPAVLASSTDAVIRWLAFDLEPRAWTLTLWDWPVIGTRSAPNLSGPLSRLAREIGLPYAAIQSVESVSVYGTATTEFVARDDSIVFGQGVPYDRYKDNEEPAIVVEYTAGMNPIPAAVKDAIKMLASFLYEHRGACDVMDGLNRSGAAMMLQPYRKYGVVF